MAKGGNVLDEEWVRNPEYDREWDYFENSILNPDHEYTRIENYSLKCKPTPKRRGENEKHS